MFSLSIHHAKTQSSTARPPSAVKAALDMAVAPPAAPPVAEEDSDADADADSLPDVDEASSSPLSVALADSVAELSAVDAVADELAASVLLTASAVELPVRDL
jgi:hypothetical protein